MGGRTIPSKNLVALWTQRRWKIYKWPTVGMIFSIVLSFVVVVIRFGGDLESHPPRLMGLAYFTMLLLALDDRRMWLRGMTLVLPLVWTFLILALGREEWCGWVFAREQCVRIQSHGEAPVQFFTVPVLVTVLGFLVSMPSLWNGWADWIAIVFRVGMFAAVAFTTYTWTGSVSVAFMTFLVQAGHLHMYVAYERQSFELFAKQISDEREERAVTQLASLERFAASEDSKTLLLNAVKLGVPKSAVVDSSTIQRIERLLVASVPTDVLAVVRGSARDVVECQGGGGNNNMRYSSPLPRYLTLPFAKVRSVDIHPGVLRSRHVVVKVISDVSGLDDTDLKQLLSCACSAVTAPQISGLTRTLAFQWEPTVHVVEENIGPYTVTLRDVALELGTYDLRLDWALFRPLGICMAKALAKLHEAGLLHREIASHTIALVSAKTCVFSPIGFLHALPEARIRVWGSTPGFAVAPEILDLDDHASFTAKCDVWSLCVVAWELLCGPFAVVSPLAFPSTVPEGVADAIIDGVSAEPDRRPTAEELLKVFERAEQIEGGAERESAILSQPVFEQMLAKVAIFEDDNEKEEEDSTRDVTTNSSSTPSSTFN